LRTTHLRLDPLFCKSRRKNKLETQFINSGLTLEQMFYTIQSEGTDLFGSGAILKDVLLTGEDVARILQLSRGLTDELMKRGLIPTVRIGGSRRVLADDLEAYIYQNRLDYGKAAQAFINHRSSEREK
ncbi:MAG: hypothetical protein A2W36_06090, partial [Chloroflexi bacterium RBG_16_58_14]